MAMNLGINHINLFEPGFHAAPDPHAVWATMRTQAPLHRQILGDGREFWSVTRYRDVCRVLGDYRAFTSERGSILTQLGAGDVSAGLMLVSTDPPRHGEIRRALNCRLTPRALPAWEDRIRQAVRAFIRIGLDHEVWDVAESAYRLPIAVAGDMMGLPEDEWDDLVRWTNMAIAPAERTFAVGSQAATLAVAHHQLFESFGRYVSSRRANGPSDDLVSHLLTMTAGRRPLTDREIVYNCYSILLGANATIPHTVTGTLLALAERPDEFRKVAADPGLIPFLVEEGLRWTSPASTFLRHAVSDVEIGGGMVSAGDAVVAWLGSANRDETVFVNAARFDVGRANNQHISFGYGPHYCLGAGLARLTLQILFEEFFATFSGIEIVGEPERLHSIFIAGFRHLRIRTRAVTALQRCPRF
jgi:cytochrome P450